MSSFKLKCPHCDKSLKVSHSLAGKSRACPYCKGTVKIPDETPVESTEFDIKVDDRPAARTSEPRRRKQQSTKSWFHEDTDSSNVSLIISAILGLAATAIFLALVFPLRQFQFGQLFWDRGWVPFVTTFIAFWSAAILFLKWQKLKRQKNSMLLDVLPTEVSQEITIDSLDKFVEHVNQLPGASGESYLINRVLRGIEHFRVRKSAAETVTMMESQSAIDANNVAGSYTLLKVFIWALPILGFIGTVIGVSGAVASLAGSLESASDISAVKDSLNDVFGGLGTAFDTTLLALIMSMMVKIPTSAMQKSEDDLITLVDEYCNENLLRRLNDGREGGAERGAGGNTAVFREAVEAAMGTHHAELENWLKKLDQIGGKLTAQVSQGWEQVNAKIQQQQHQHVVSMQKQQQAQATALQENLKEMTNAAGEIQQRLASLSEQTLSMSAGVNKTVEGSAEVLSTHFSGLEKGLGTLNEVLSQLGEKQVVVQPIEKSGWFGSRRKRKTRQ